MGVSGSGKSTVGAGLARAIGVHFLDADDLHPIRNVEKMASGTPLTDEDRWLWLASVGGALAAAGDDGSGIVVACSALKRSYRDRIREAAPLSWFLYLEGSDAVLANRVALRAGHFMPAALLTSQLAALEPLADDETGMTLSIDQPVSRIVDVAAGLLVSPSPG
jgi:carbohydrate kinase (thermoresistant glucokinase family)